MAISKDEVLALAQLARLSVTDAEAEKLGADMTEILQYVSQVAAVSMDSDTPQKPALRNVMREDIPYDDSLPTAGKADAVRASFPKEEDGYNAVRKIIEK